MFRHFSLAAALLAATAVPTFAADLIVDAAAAPMVDTGFLNSRYFQVLGGAALPGSYEYDDGLDYDLDAGYALAGTVGVVVLDGVSVELDVFHANRVLPDYDYYSVATTSLMANVKYTAALNDMFSLYAAVGAGVIHVSEQDDNAGETYTGNGFGYQLIGGVAAEIADGISLLGEVRYQNSFSDIGVQNWGITVPTASALVGLKFEF